jgi:formate hydrogenlyase transcriptional activator
VLSNPLPSTETPFVTTYPAASAATTLKDSERTLILSTLESVGWVIGGRKGAAAKLGCNRTTLIHKMKRLGIARPSSENEEDLMEQATQEPARLPQL